MTKLVQFLTALATTLVLLVAVEGATALAQTSDGRTPSEETICDSEVGKAFGFCNAYCEAMDCDSDEANASEEACSKVRDKFIEATDGGELPCEASEPVTGFCPCNAFTDGSLASQGLIERNLSTLVAQFCIQHDLFDKEACYATFDCSIDITGPTTTIISLNTSSDTSISNTTNWRFQAAAGSCTAELTHGTEHPTFLQRREVDPRFPIPWFQVPLSFSTEDTAACLSAIPGIVSSIETALSELLERPDFTCTYATPPSL